MPVLNETWSLRKVTEITMTENKKTVLEVIIPIHKEKTLEASKLVINELIKEYGDVIKVVEQDLPFVGGAIRKGFEVAQGDYCLLLASDLETDPYLVKTMIEKAQNNEADIVTASRWMKGGDFGKYNPFKKVLNKLFQSFFSLLYGTHLTDMTYGFRVFKIEVIKSIEWQELRHPLFLELILKPLKHGYRIMEIPAKWSAREEGESQIALLDYFDYFIIGLKLRFN